MISYSAILTAIELICQPPEVEADVGQFAPNGSSVRTVSVSNSPMSICLDDMP